VVTNSPANVERCAGSNASFGVIGSSVPAINYQWQVSTDGGTSWTALAGATSSTYTANGVIAVMNNNRYRCLLSNNTCTTPVASADAILTVRVVPTVGLTAAPLTSLLPGQTTTLTATPSASTGGSIRLSWSFNGSVFTNNANTYIADVSNLGSYQVRVTEVWPNPGGVGGGLGCFSESPIVTITANVSDRLYLPESNDGNFSVSYYNTEESFSAHPDGESVLDKVFCIRPLHDYSVNLTQASRGFIM
jgi:hypothetical protein